MKSCFPRDSVFSRVENFRWNVEALEKRYREDKNSFLDLEILSDVVITFCKSNYIEMLSPSERLEQVFRKIFGTMKKSNLASRLFCGASPLAGPAYEAYVFTACSCFLHTSKRIKAMPISEFVKKNHPLDFTDPDSPNYREPSLFQSEADRFRKARQRRLSLSQVYFKQNTQWNAISKDGEYEWSRWYSLEDSSDVVRNTDKYIGNLYNGFRKAIKSAQDDGYYDRVQNAYKKFLSKLKKLKYADFLELYKTDLTRICANREYFGINLYRLERRLQPYKIINDVKRLTECQSPEEEVDLLIKTVSLDELCFPKIYENLLRNPCDLAEQYAEEFLHMLRTVTVISNLIFDELIEKGFLGDDWETLLLDRVNQMADEVLYDPQKVELFTADHAQEKFIRLLHAGVFLEMCVACNIAFSFENLLIE